MSLEDETPQDEVEGTGLVPFIELMISSTFFCRGVGRRGVS